MFAFTTAFNHRIIVQTHKNVEITDERQVIDVSQCPYYEDHGPWYEIQPFCTLVGNSVSDEKYKYFCDTCDHENCDYYKNR